MQPFNLLVSRSESSTTSRTRRTRAGFTVPCGIVRCGKPAILGIGQLVLLATLIVPTWGNGSVGLAPAASAAESPQTDAKSPKQSEMPLATLSVAGIDRLLSDVDYIFDEAERPELSQIVRGILTTFGNLKGMDHKKPFGLMVYLDPGLAPQPTLIGYVPVSSIDELMQSIRVGPFKLTKVDGKDDRYELAGPNRTLHVLLRGHYAFVGGKPESLDRRFPDPQTITEKLTQRYDLAVAAHLANVPVGIKTMLLDLLRARAESAATKRTRESDDEFHARISNQQAALGFIEQFLTEGKELTVGWTVAKESRNATLELRIGALPASRFSESLQIFQGKMSRFAGLINREVPVSISSSMSWGKYGRQIVLAALKKMEKNLTEFIITEENEQDPVRSLFDSLRSTVQADHRDFVFQILGEPPERFVTVGGFHVAEGRKMATALSALLEKIRDKAKLRNLKLNVFAHRGITFHRFEPVEVREIDQRLYGDHYAYYFGIGPDVAWIAVGSDDAIPQLKASMDKVAEHPGSPQATPPALPFQLVVHASSGLALLEDAGKANRLSGLAEEAFSKGADMIRVELSAAGDHEIRLRVGFDSGFLRLIGLAVAARIDGR